MTNESVTHPITRWEFDNCSCVKGGRSWIELVEAIDSNQFDWRLTTNIDSNQKMTIDAYRDQWGTYITFTIGESQFTVAQEDETKSFVDAMIAALTKFKEITDFKTEPPKIIDMRTTP